MCSKRLSNTVQFKHKTITNLSLTPADKLMHTIANCKAALAGIKNIAHHTAIQELHTIIEHVQEETRFCIYF
jgi:hypothetical protein